MNQSQIIEVEEGKNWFKEIVNQSQDIDVPKDFEFLKRRLSQLKCHSLISNTPAPSISRAVIRYLLGIGYISYKLFCSKFKSKTKAINTFSIWDSDITPHVDDRTFNTFIQSKQVIKLNIDEVLFVKYANTEKAHKNILYLDNPIYQIIEHLNIPIHYSFILVLKQFHNFIIFLKLSLSCSQSRETFKDFLIEPLIQLYTKMGLNKLYRTNSNVNSQEYWCEQIDFNTVWYSINSKSMQYKYSSKEPVPEYPLFDFVHFGTSWTWNEANAIWLRSIEDHPVNVVGPIIFRTLPDLQKKTNVASKPKKILIFDVTPFNESHVRGKVLSKGYNYYNEDNCLSFIEDILNTFKNENFSLLLKPKREYGEIHSQKYIEYLNKAKKQIPNFQILSSKSDLFAEISEADLVISIPLSSPFEIAKFMNIPALYYDPSDSVDFDTMGYNNNDYVVNIESLKERIGRLSLNNNGLD